MKRHTLLVCGGLTLLLPLTGSAPAKPSRKEGRPWAKECMEEVKRARDLLARRDPRFAKGEVSRFNESDGQWNATSEGNGVRYVACIEKKWCFEAVAAPLEMIDLPHEELPYKWDALPEVTVCLSSGRRTKNRMGWLSVTFNEKCFNRNVLELKTFVDVMRPAVDACLKRE